MTEPHGKTLKTAPKNRREAVSPARKAAFDVLVAVGRGNGHSDDLLRAKQVSDLAPNDRNLATALVLGVLRWQIWLDAQVRPFLKRPDARLDEEVLIALRLGAFQIARMERIPTHAAIDESVELAKRAGHRFASAMINAVLRKFAADSRPTVTESSTFERVLTQTHPAWMIERWTKTYGDEATASICRYDQSQPAFVVRLAELAVESELLEDGVVLSPGELLTLARVVIAGDIFTSKAFQAGRVRIQDEGSQLVAEIAAASLKDSGANILDACAAPGGKTLILAERNPQAHIVAVENNPRRLEQLNKRMSVYADRVQCQLADATALGDEAEFELILADVPCSGTGTLCRNPEIRHRLSLEDIMRQAERQRQILKSVIGKLLPGGHVLYSTCSLEPEENEQVIAAVLSEIKNVRIKSLDMTIADLERESILIDRSADLRKVGLTPSGSLQLLPGSFKTDGFFMTLLERFE